MCASLKTRRLCSLGAAVVVACLWAGVAGASTRLLMFETEYCEWCEAWDAEIGIAYHKTDEGRIAPLERLDIHEALPEDVALDRPPRYTPTFVLVHEDAEVGRIEGYAGEHFFYPMLNALLDRLPDRAATTEDSPDATH